MRIVLLHEARPLPSWLIFDVRQKMKRIVVASGIAVAGCASIPPPGPAGHVILDAEHAVTVAYWKPSEEDVQALERDMARLFAWPDHRLSEMQGARLSDYGVKYYGTVEKGRRIIIGKGVHLSQRSVSDLQEANARDVIELEAFGGGSLYFTIAYDPEKKKVLYVHANAPL
jgi:hypothetical protein